MKKIILLLIFLFLADPASGGSLLRGPKKTQPQGPIYQADASLADQGVFKKIILSPVLLYRTLSGSISQDKCSHHPSCSTYCILTIKKHGILIGSVMAFDRLQHESNEARFSPLIKVNGAIKVHDPVENNDFWWFTPKAR
ncbi:MAG: membrane protein insertion efficiency factor YidD [Thermodesulfobacteriota bacterium]|nr:membrane protein insertion efficiency factor YidD [Thermodesulfobacteriota bacterium]